MAKGTIIFFFILTIIATLLLGINIGKKLGVSQSAIIITPSPTLTITTTATPNLSAASSAGIKKTAGTTTYTDVSCGFSFSYPGSFIQQKSVNSQSTILTDPDDPTSLLAAACAAAIPRPPVSSDKIEAITLGGTAATLYHDQTDDGAPRDEVIVKHPSHGKEIILAGYGETFQQVLSSFKFIQ